MFLVEWFERIAVGFDEIFNGKSEIITETTEDHPSKTELWHLAGQTTQNSLIRVLLEFSFWNWDLSESINKESTKNRWFMWKIAKYVAHQMLYMFNELIYHFHWNECDFRP